MSPIREGMERRNQICETGADKLDVAHAFAADDRASDFDAAFLADDAFVPDAAIFAAVTFVVLVRTKDALVEEAALFASAGCGS